MVPTDATVYGHASKTEGVGIAANATANALGARYRPVNALFGTKHVAESRHNIVQFAPVPEIADWVSRTRARGKNVIAYWVFESTVPFRGMLEHHGDYDQIWTPSKFCVDAFAAHGVEAHLVPHPMGSFPLRPPRPVEHFAIIYNNHSGVIRKNPMAGVLAFAHAFTPSDGRRLTVKSRNMAQQTRYEIEHVVNETDLDIKIADEEYTEEEMGRFWSSVDCLVSLHKSEGFGLHVAEAILRGIPTVRTGHSGTEDFPYGASHRRVSYDLVDIDDAFFMSGQWAYPSITDASVNLQMVTDSNTAQPRQALARTLSPTVVGETMRNLLQRK